MRKLAIAIALALATAGTARADVAIGGFFGEPTGLDIKLGLSYHTGLDILLGWLTYREFDGGAYGHVTYLVTPVVGHGDSVLVPLRLGIGAAIFEQGRDDINAAVRFPLEVGLRFRSAPLELYGEIAFKITFVDPNDNYPFADVDGGIGLRFYF
jgi:hypothetical protein